MSKTLDTKKPVQGLEDHELLYRWRDGDQEAGDVLVQRHFRPIFRFFRAKLDRDAEDLVQQTFMGCLEAADRFMPGRPLQPYLFEIAQRQLCKHLRKQRGTRRAAPISELPVASPDTTPSQNAARNESGRLLLNAMRQIPLDLQTAVQLHYWEGLTMGEIGDVLGVPAGTVKSRLHRARELLRAEVCGLNLLEAAASVTNSRGQR